MKLLDPINYFLKCETPQSWSDEAIKPENLPTLLVDHANCELKAYVCNYIKMQELVEEIYIL